jgi:hypothetical protein
MPLTLHCVHKIFSVKTATSKQTAIRFIIRPENQKHVKITLISETLLPRKPVNLITNLFLSLRNPRTFEAIDYYGLF